MRKVSLDPVYLLNLIMLRYVIIRFSDFSDSKCAQLEDPKSWTAFLKEKTLSLVAGRPNVATSGKFLVKYARTIAK